MAEKNVEAFEVSREAQGDGKALVCCVGSKELEALKPVLDVASTQLKQVKELDAFVADLAAEGDGKALVCCIGSAAVAK